MSVPEAKALSPAPWNMSTLIERSLLACSHICASRSYIAKVKALRACGRLNVARPIPSLTPKRRSFAPVEASSMWFGSRGRTCWKGNLNAEMRESKRGAGHEAILNALVRRDGLALAHALRTHLRDKHEEVIRAGFTDSSRTAQSGWTMARVCCKPAAVNRLREPLGIDPPPVDASRRPCCARP